MIILHNNIKNNNIINIMYVCLKNSMLGGITGSVLYLIGGKIYNIYKNKKNISDLKNLSIKDETKNLVNPGLLVGVGVGVSLLYKKNIISTVSNLSTKK